MNPASHKQYIGIERLQSVIQHLHGCGAEWVESAPVKEVSTLTGHPKAKRAYGWFYGEPEQFVTILELPPVDSAAAAVKVGVAYQVKKGNHESRKHP